VVAAIATGVQLLAPALGPAGTGTVIGGENLVPPAHRSGGVRDQPAERLARDIRVLDDRGTRGLHPKRSVLMIEPSGKSLRASPSGTTTEGVNGLASRRLSFE
jgi:hypothetical protein